MSTGRTRILAIASLLAFGFTWACFGGVVWASNHPRVENYLYTHLNVNVFLVMLTLSLLGLALGLLVLRRVRWVGPVSTLLNAVSLIVIVFSPKGML